MHFYGFESLNLEQARPHDIQLAALESDHYNSLYIVVNYYFLFYGLYLFSVSFHLHKYSTISHTHSQSVSCCLIICIPCIMCTCTINNFFKVK